MRHLHVGRLEEIGLVTLNRGKVNALNGPLIEELGEGLRGLGRDDSVRAIVLTGSGKFFSFGFDIPEFLGFSREDFLEYLRSFTQLYTELFVFPKPVVAALNGHAIAGGCMIATACDLRVMASGGGKISLNEITFGASVFAGAVAMLKHLVGGPGAERILYSGRMYDAEEAREINLVDVVVPEAGLMARAREEARRLGAQDPVAFASLKRLIRGPMAEQMRREEADSLGAFIDIWYSEATRARLAKILIR